MSALRWDGTPGHYEVYYVSLTDRGSGCGAWIRYTLCAPLVGEPTCALWFVAMDPRSKHSFAHKASFPIDQLSSRVAPFGLTIGAATLDHHGMRGSLDDGRIAWDLTWTSRSPAMSHVHPLVERAGLAQTVLTLPHPDLEITGTLVASGRPLQLAGARGGLAHLWGSKHATRWAWTHCNDFATLDGDPRPDTYLDAVSVFVTRAGRVLGPSTPVVGRFLGEPFQSTNPARLIANRSRFDVTGWHLEAAERNRRVTVDVAAPASGLVGVSYTDPDGERAHCYNSEIASTKLQVHDRSGRGRAGWVLRETLVADGRAHFEYAQRPPLPGHELQIA